MLVDNSNRKVDYLRISVTDRCNLRCIYCTPENGITYRPHEEILTFEEIARVARILVSLGINKIRLTGGEVLVRKDIVNLIKYLTNIEGIEEVSLTTNGALLHPYAEQLKKAGLKRINISLDTLKEDRFKKITGGGCIHRVFDGIGRAKELNFHPLKLNMVVMKGINDDEIVDFIDFAFSKGIILRFIEFMKVTPLWREDYFIPIEEVMKICERRFPIEIMGSPGPGPAVYYKTKEGGLLGFIKTDEKTCRICTRLRLTSTGELKSCLYETNGFLLREFLRNGFSDEKIRSVVERRMRMKQDVGYKSYRSPEAYMCSIGG
ncbi:GTP 3',8-cyclase MoaA [Candidatus Omnitrophota bacterium]